MLRKLADEFGTGRQLMSDLINKLVDPTADYSVMEVLTGSIGAVQTLEVMIERPSDPLPKYVVLVDQHQNVLSAQIAPTFSDSQQVPLLIEIGGRKDFYKNTINAFMLVYSQDRTAIQTLLDKF